MTQAAPLALTDIVPVTKIIDGRNVCIISNPKFNTAYASVTLRGGYYTEQVRADIGITHMIEHIIFESWKKCYTYTSTKSKSGQKNGSRSIDAISASSNPKTKTKIKSAHSKSTPKKSCLHFWNNHPVQYNGVTNCQNVGMYIYGLASESDNIVDYITQMICSCTQHLNMAMLAHVKNTVLNELIEAQASPMNQLVLELMNTQIRSHTAESSGAFKIFDNALQIENLKKITPEHIRDYYYRFFIPENAVFVYSGCVTEAQIRRTLSRHLSVSHRHTFAVPRPLRLTASGASKKNNKTARANKNMNKITNAVVNGVQFDTYKIFSKSFIDTSKCSRTGTQARPRGRDNRVMVVTNPAVKNTAMFCIFLPVFPNPSMTAAFQSIRRPMFARMREIQVLKTIMSSELLELLRMKQSLVYSINVTYSFFTGVNVVQITGTCLPKDAKTVIRMCINYVRERQSGRVPEKTLSSVTGRLKMNTYVNSYSISGVSAFFESVIVSAAVSNGASPLRDIIEQSQFISYNAAVKEIDSVSVSGIMEHFASICIENAVSGYSIRGKLKA
jgi:predicted Zn-dependent peptidase